MLAGICFSDTSGLSGKRPEDCCFDSLNPDFSPLPPTGYLPNSAHAVEAMLAAASIGAIWSSTSPDFGVNVSWGPVGGVKECPWGGGGTPQPLRAFGCLS